MIVEFNGSFRYDMMCTEEERIREFFRETGLVNDILLADDKTIG